MVTKTVTTVFDDITDQPGAKHRALAIWDGKNLDWYDIDLLPDGYKRLMEQFNRGLAKYLAAGRLRRIKGSDMGALFAAPAEAIDKIPAESRRTELPPEGATKKALAKTTRKPTASRSEPVLTVDGKPAKKPGNTYAVRAARAKSLPPLDQRPIDPATGKPFTDHIMRTQRRPGLFTWHEKHWQLLGLPEPTGVSTGRVPKLVEAAYDRYRGLPVSADDLHPDDMDRLTAPSGNGTIPTPKEVFSKG